MYIEAIKIKIVTNSNKKFGVYVPFNKEDGTRREVNLIYGENNLGKSTLIKSIIYALGGEDLYGKASWNHTNFPPIMKEINGDRVTENTIFLQLVNEKKQRVVIARDALERSTPVVVYNDVKIDNLDETKNIDYYKTKKDAGIEGNETFQEFLFDYFKIPEVQYDGIKVYFQNLMPLFIVPQTSWNDIQGINPYYNIPEIRQKAFEILMNFSSVKNLSEKIKLKTKQSKLKEKRRFLKDVEDIMSVVKFKRLNENEREITELNLKLKEYESQLAQLEDSRVEIIIDNIAPLKEKYRRINKVIRRYEQQVTSLEKEIKEYNFYLNKIELDIGKLDKLRTAKKLISILPIEKCPHCLGFVDINEDLELHDDICSLCGNEISINNQSKNEQIFGYLLDEKKDFEKLKRKKEIEKIEIEGKLFVFKLDIKEIETIINDLDINLRPGYLQQYHIVSREIGKINNEKITLNKERGIISKYELIIKDIESLEKEISDLESQINEGKGEKEDKEKFEYFEKVFKGFLKKLDFIKDGFDGDKLKDANNKIFKNIKIDKNDYKPKIDGRNLYYITSSSGLIRIIISYYLALLVTSVEKDTNFPRILIFDEPRQQNLDEQTFKKFTDLILEIANQYEDKIQIIFTSGNKGSLLNEHMVLDLGTNDYLIKPQE
ncbi:AAA family ATPase [Peribacillus butanolivorans]|uniref:AAA family ATPase n=1 Tax=Peribacillus butanolivorans TaxID=421767 RepID=UPI00363B2739